MQLVSGLYRVIASKENDKKYFKAKSDDDRSALYLKVVPYRTKNGDNIGTEWIKVKIYGMPADWYQEIEHNTVVFLQGIKHIEVDGEYTNPTVYVSNQSDMFVPVVPIRYDSVEDESEAEVPKSKSVTKNSKEVPF